MGIIDFYLNNEPDDKGRFIKDIWHMKDSQIRFDQTAFNRLFPQDEQIKDDPFNFILSEEDISKLKTDVNLVNSIICSSECFFDFFGFKLNFSGEDIKITKSDSYRGKKIVWLKDSSDKIFVIARALRFFYLVGFEDYSKSLLGLLKSIYNDEKHILKEKTLKLWESYEQPIEKQISEFRLKV